MRSAIMRSGRSVSLGIVAAVLIALPASAPPAAAKQLTCRASIIKAGGSLAHVRLRALQQCEDQIVRGRRPIETDCRTDARTTARIVKAVKRLRATLDSKCGGKNKLCSLADTGVATDDALDSIGWDIGTCPDLENAGCTNVIQDCGDIADCLVCVNETPLDRAIRLSYDALVLPTANSQKKLNRCQKAIGREAARFFAGRARALKSCWLAVNRGSRGFGTPCPVGDPRGKTLHRMERAESQMIARICAACGGADRLCDGTGDFLPSEIGFPSQCPDLKVPDGPSCGGTVSTLEGLVECVSCVTQFQVDCLDALTVPWNGPYPLECNSAAGCGNGRREGAEACDGGDDAACPGQCQPDCTCAAGPTPVPTPVVLPPCPAAPQASCRQPALPAKSLIALANSSDDNRDRLVWKWLKGTLTVRADFGNPVMTGGTNYQLCIYDVRDGGPTLRLDTNVPAGGTCGDRRLGPCWKKTRWGVKYVDRSLTRNGLLAIDLREGVDGQAKIVVRGKGPNLVLPDLSTLTQPVTVQLTNSHGVCWEASYSLPPVKHTPEEFKAKAD